MAASSDMMFQQFPQPSRPVFADHSQNTYTESCSSGFAEEHSLHILDRIMKKLDKKGRELLKKLISKIEDDVPIEERLNDFRGSPVADELEKFIGSLNVRDLNDVTATMDRGLDRDISGPDDEPKMERFKVRTVNIPGPVVVKQEEK